LAVCTLGFAQRRLRTRL